LIDVKRGLIRHKCRPARRPTAARRAVIYRIEIKEKTHTNRRFMLSIR
jgi:hypothetical protein